MIISNLSIFKTFHSYLAQGMIAFFFYFLWKQIEVKGLMSTPIFPLVKGRLVLGFICRKTFVAIMNLKLFLASRKEDDVKYMMNNREGQKSYLD